MVSYNPKEWLRPLYQFHRSDTFRKLLPLLLLIGAYSALVVYLEHYYFDLPQDSYLKNITTLHSLLGFAISILLVFRTNTAYDRWWEGRKHWGALVNCSRNLAVKLDVMIPQEDKRNRRYFERLLSIFPHELRRHLQNEKTRLELDSEPHPEIPDFDLSRHVPSQVISLMNKRIIYLYREKIIRPEELIILNTEMVAFLDICGACERIKNTPIPWSYITFIKKFIFIYVLTMPIGFVFTLSWLAVPLSMFVFYVLASLEVIAEEIEEPFGIDANDLPMERLSVMIAKNVTEILN